MADDTKVFVEMLVASGATDEIKWFSYRPSYFGEIVRIEWDKDTMFVDVPPDYAHYLLSHKYARAMTDAEIEAYTAPAKTVKEPEPVTTTSPPPPPSPKPAKKGDKS